MHTRIDLGAGKNLNETGLRAEGQFELHAGKDYVSPEYLPRGIPDHEIKVQLILACRRLNIRPERWPFKGEILLLPGAAMTLDGCTVSPERMGIAVVPIAFSFPPFDLSETEAAWRKRAFKHYQQAARLYLAKCKKVRELMMLPRARRRFNGKKRTDAVSLEKRCEMAAKRYCLRTSWRALAKETGYGEDRIRKMVISVLSAAGLRANQR